MLLAIDVGNTNIVYGLFKGKKLVREWRSATHPFRLPRMKGKIDRVIIASVVPSVNKLIKKSLIRHSAFGIRHLSFVSASNIPQLKVKLRNKGEVGADRLVDALAAYELYGGPAIVVDFGTATTFDVITARGEYLGGAIAPGLLLARDALYSRTAKLPRVSLKAARSVVGKNTVEAIRSGLIYGYAALVEGMVKRIKGHRVLGSRVKVIATGGLARLICKYTKVVDIIDDKLTLKGLMLIGRGAK